MNNSNTSNHSIGQKAHLIRSPLFLNGITRAGKFILGKIVSHIHGVEHFQYASLLEHLPFLSGMGLISNNVAINLMRVHLDEHAYNMAIGRNLNFRFDDASSLYHSSEINQYLQRSLENNLPHLLEDYKKSERLPCFIIHETMPHINVVFDAYPQPFIIDLQRHPVDLIYSWYRRGWGGRQVEDPLSFAPVLGGASSSIPWYASAWKDRYEKANRMDRIIGSISYLISEGQRTLKSLTSERRKRICQITYEKLVTDPQTTVKMLAQFLNRSVEETLSTTLSKEKLPNPNLLEKKADKLNEIRKESSQEYWEILECLIADYEQEYEGI